MGKKNRQARKRLYHIFGKVDMFTEAKVEEKLKLLEIKGYKVFEQEQKFKGRPISQQLTFHHLKHRSERRRCFSPKWLDDRIIAS